MPLDLKSFPSLKASVMIAILLGIRFTCALDSVQISESDFVRDEPGETKVPTIDGSSFIQKGKLISQKGATLKEDKCYSDKDGKHCGGNTLSPLGSYKYGHAPGLGSADKNKKACEGICDEFDKCKGFVYRASDDACFWKGGTLKEKTLAGHTCLQKGKAPCPEESEQPLKTEATAKPEADAGGANLEAPPSSEGKEADMCYSNASGEHCGGNTLNPLGSYKYGHMPNLGSADKNKKACEDICDQFDTCTGFTYRSSDEGCFWKGGTLAPKAWAGHDCLQKGKVPCPEESEQPLNTEAPAKPEGDAGGANEESEQPLKTEAAAKPEADAGGADLEAPASSEAPEESEQPLKAEAAAKPEADAGGADLEAPASSEGPGESEQPLKTEAAAKPEADAGGANLEAPVSSEGEGADMCYSNTEGNHCGGNTLNPLGSYKYGHTPNLGTEDKNKKACEDICDQFDTCTGFTYRSSDDGCFWKGGTLAPKDWPGHDCLQKGKIPCPKETLQAEEQEPEEENEQEEEEEKKEEEDEEEDEDGDEEAAEEEEEPDLETPLQAPSSAAPETPELKVSGGMTFDVPSEEEPEQEDEHAGETEEEHDAHTTKEHCKCVKKVSIVNGEQTESRTCTKNGVEVESCEDDSNDNNNDSEADSDDNEDDSDNNNEEEAEKEEPDEEEPLQAPSSAAPEIPEIAQSGGASIDVPTAGGKCHAAEWSKWSSCSSSCGKDGIRTRTRLVDPVNCTANQAVEACQAKACPVDCKWNEWNPWGECSQKCHGGNMTRSRSVKVHASIASEKQMPGDKCCGKAVESQPCGAQKEDCVMAPWSEWTGCSQTCNTGTQRRKRHIEKQPACGGHACLCSLLEVRNCQEKECSQDCKMSAWTEWSGCPAKCGGAIMTRTRKVINSPSAGGKECDELVETKNCAAKPCPRDCVLDSWSDWTTCSASCDGFQARTRSVKVAPVGGGTPCEDLQESKECNSNCKLDCQLGEWKEWSPCSKTCGGGTSERTRAIVQQVKNGGAACDSVSEAKTCNCDACKDAPEAPPAPAPEAPPVFGVSAAPPAPEPPAVSSSHAFSYAAPPPEPKAAEPAPVFSAPAPSKPGGSGLERIRKRAASRIGRRGRSRSRRSRFSRGGSR